MADAVEDAGGMIHDLLSEVIPYPIFRILAGFSNLIYSLLGTANNPASWTSTLLPPLITFFLAYFALVTAYRTVRSMLALAWFGIKWGAIIGGLIAVWAWWTDNTDAINSTGAVPVNSLGPLMNTLYAQLPDLTAPGDTSTSTRRNRRQRTSSSQTRRRTRSSTRANQRTFSLDPTDDLADDLGAGYGAFADMFGRSQADTASDGGVDFATLLRTLVTEGQRQGIDALSALRAAGTVQDELRRFQQDPTAWFAGVGERFRTSNTDDSTYSTRSRTRQQQRRGRGGTGINANQQDGWWTNVASSVNDFFKADPDQSTTRSRTRRQRSTYDV